MHSWAAAVAVPACALLVLSAQTPSARTAAAVYSVTLVAVFGTSAAYHRLTRTERARRLMQRADHSMIYLLIAGTYVPLCVVALPPEWGIPVLAVIGSVALVGVVLKLTAFERRRRLSYALYPVMGWGVVVAAPALASHLSNVELALVIGGGLAYTCGLPVLMTRRPNPWPLHFGYHEIWHVVTIVAAGLHFAAVAAVVV